MDSAGKERRRGDASSDGSAGFSTPSKSTNVSLETAVSEAAESAMTESVDEAMTLQQQSAGTHFTSLLGKREAEDARADGEGEEDPTRLLAVAEEEQEQPLVQCVGMEQCFDSWEDFHRAMEEYCRATHQPMRLRTSDSARAVNSRAAKRNSLKEPIDESVGFVKKLYLCTHGVKTKPRGKGKRPRQHYRYMGCPAMIRACISERKPNEPEGHGKGRYVVRVVAQINRHNHRLSEHLYKSYSETRVVIDDELVVPNAHGRPKEEHVATASAAAASVEQQMTTAVHPDLEDPALKTNRTTLLLCTCARLAADFILTALAMVLCSSIPAPPRPHACCVSHQNSVQDGKARSGRRLIYLPTFLVYSVGWIGTGIMGASMCGHLMVRAPHDNEGAGSVH
jgi:hypothetical protein